MQRWALRGEGPGTHICWRTEWNSRDSPSSQADSSCRSGRESIWNSLRCRPTDTGIALEYFWRPASPSDSCTTCCTGRSTCAPSPEESPHPTSLRPLVASKMKNFIRLLANQQIFKNLWIDQIFIVRWTRKWASFIYSFLYHAWLDTEIQTIDYK